MKRRDLLKTVPLAAAGLSFAGGIRLSAEEKERVNKPIIIDEIIVQLGRGKSDLRFSYGEVKTTDFLLVRIKSGGLVGYGEVINKNITPLAKVAQTLIGKDARSLDNLLPEVDTVGHAAREPLSMALYDLVAKTAGVPFNVLLGGPAKAQVPVLPVIFPKDAEHSGVMAKQYFETLGTKNVKFKMFGKFEQDMANLKAIRANLPHDGFINADANKGYKNYDEFLKYLPEFEKAGLTYFEDPIDGTLEQCKSLRGKTSIKIILDAFARTNKNTREIISMGAADLINLHPNHQGGMANLLMKANAINLMGMSIWNGGTGYFGVGTAVYLHLGSLKGLSMPCEELGGVYDHGFTDWIIKEPFPIKDGMVTLPDEPGLGIEIDENCIAKFLVEEVTAK